MQNRRQRHDVAFTALVRSRFSNLDHGRQPSTSAQLVEFHQRYRLNRRWNELQGRRRHWNSRSVRSAATRTLRCAAKRSTEHVCRECGHTETRHYGRCPCCLSWDTMIERPSRRRGGGGRRERDEAVNARRQRLWGAQIPGAATESSELERWLQSSDALPLSLGLLQEALNKAMGASTPGTNDRSREEAASAAGNKVSSSAAASKTTMSMNSGRLVTCSVEFNRVTGGGVVPGSLLLLGGEPGNGKSTLMLQIAGDIAANGLRVLYISAEESVEQVGIRAARLFGLGETQRSQHQERIRLIQQNLLIMHEARLENILDVVEDMHLELDRPVSNPGTGSVERLRTTMPATGAVEVPPSTTTFGKDAASRSPGDSNSAAPVSPLALLIIDSIQTVYIREDGMDSSAPGSVVQVRQCTNRLLEVAKRHQRFRESAHRTAILLIGHVTKSGDLAGPKLLEHMVDVVLYLESEQGLLQYRTLRCTKNRFGPTDIGIFDLTAQGLLDVPNPSLLYFQSPETNEDPNDKMGTATESAPISTFSRQVADGAAMSMVLDGTRAFLVEIQALVVKTSLTQPRRTSNGFDLSRLYVILAVLSKRAHLRLEAFDVYVNVVGGARIQDPAADLATAVALSSSLLTRAPRQDTAFIGEVGLQGEVRIVPRIDLRLRDIARLGFRYCVCSDRLSQSQEKKAQETGLQVIRCGHIAEVLKFGIPTTQRDDE
ncbi:hypothetical protein CCYA_CCYA10G2870 [Cyanidiococcus yangmingshanensis]|nr:hypothetical protein CCYA_CCYA10G2870 [Cyanidiococcus yangmingshanensis]